MSQRARTDIELIRTLAALAVVTIHVAGGLVEAEPQARDTVTGMTNLALNAASRFSVPAFFAVSGWTFLVASPVRSARALVDRLLRVIIPLLSWTIIYGLAANRHEMTFAVIPKIVWMFVSGMNIYHFWFVYAYVTLFLAIGLLMLVARGEISRRDLILGSAALVILMSSTSLLLLVASITDVPAMSAGWSAPPYSVIYAILGAALLWDGRTSRWTRLGGAALYVVAVGATIAWSRRFGMRVPGDYGSTVTGAATVGALLFLRGWHLGPAAARVVTTIGRASFGVYLVHLLLLNVVNRLFAPVAFLGSYGGWPGLIRGPAYVFATFGLALAASLAWGRVPILRRLLG